MPKTTLRNERIRQVTKSVKNYIINGGFDFWQRGTSFSTTTNFTYSADRFRLEGGGSSTLANASRSNDTPNANFEYSMFADNDGGLIGGGANTDVIQPIEYKFVKELSGKELTFSFWIKTQNLQPNTTIRIRVYTPGVGLDDYSTGRISDFGSGSGVLQHTNIITDDIGTTWKKVNYTFTCPDFEVENKGLAIGIQMTKNNIQSVVSEGFFTTGWVLHEKTTEEVEFRRFGGDYTEEFQLCQRYHQRMLLTTFTSLGDVFVFSGNVSGSFTVYMSTPMRELPIVDVSGSVSDLRVANDSGSTSNCTDIARRSFNEGSTAIGINLFWGASVGAFGVSVRVYSPGQFLLFDAEL